MATVIDCNHMDHLTNFESSAEVVNLLQAAGFIVVDSMEYVASREIKDCWDKAIGLAYVCQRSQGIPMTRHRPFLVRRPSSVLVTPSVRHLSTLPYSPSA